MFTRRTRPLGRSEAHKNNLWNWQSQDTRSDALRGRCETVFCLSAAVLARPWPVAGANQMFDVRVLCFLMSHSGQQGVVAEGSSARSLQFVSASGDTHTQPLPLRSYWFDYVTSCPWLQGLNFYYSPWNEKCSSGNTFIDRAFIFRSERENFN